jgi:hypothetical protein
MIIFYIFNASTPKWVSEEAANRHHYKMLFMAVVLVLLAIALYYAVGKKFLTNQGSIFKNLLSVSITAFIGIFLWVMAFNIDLTGPSNSLLNSELWQVYYMYNGYSLFLINEWGINNQYLFLLSSFIPSVTMAVSMRNNRK